MSSSATQSFNRIINNFRVGMLTTRTSTGQLRARPMQIADVSDNCDIWFVTDGDSAKLDEIAADPNVNVSMQGTLQSLSLSGKATVQRNESKIAELWNSAWQVWFPDGVDDSDIVLIHIDAEDGEFWDMSGMKALRYALDTSKAFFRGERVNVADDMHGKVEL